MMTLVEKLFSFKGRLRRQDYWLLSIAVGIVEFAVAQGLTWSMAGFSSTMFGGARITDLHTWSLPVTIQLFVLLGFLWPLWAIMVKRGHDRNRPAALLIAVRAALLVLSYLPLNLLGLGEQSAAMTLIVGLLGLPVWIWLFIDLGCLDGPPGPNRYGPSPKGIDTSVAVFD